MNSEVLHAQALSKAVHQFPGGVPTTLVNGKGWCCVAKIDEDYVQEILQSVWRSCASIRHEPARTYARWRVLYEFRNESPENAANVEYAAAEHFALAQYFVATGLYSSSQVVRMTRAYELLKYAGLSKFMKHSDDKPTVDPSLVIMEWGLKGVVSGERIRKKWKIPKPTTHRPVKQTVNDSGAKLIGAANVALGGMSWIEQTTWETKEVLKGTWNNIVNGPPALQELQRAKGGG